MFNRAKLYSHFLLLGVVLPAAMAFGDGNPGGKLGQPEQFVPGRDSYRASFDLQVPRRFASRYLREVRSLEIRVSPAKASEFEVTRFYDSRFIHRVFVEEKNNEVVLSFQLKNAPVAWFVGHQENPWRIVVDIWKTEPAEPRGLEQEWEWQDDLAGVTRGPRVASAAQGVPLVGKPATVKPVEIDLPRDGVPQKLPSQTVLQVSGPQDDSQTASNDLSAFRIEPVLSPSPEAIVALERRAGTDVGSVDEFDSLEKLAAALYKSGASQQSIPLFRRLTTLNGRRFQDSPRLLWMAGESSYLAGKPELANDYFQTLLARFRGQESSYLAQLRLLDLRSKQSEGQTPSELNRQYLEIAFEDRAPWSARIGAAVRVLDSIIASKPETAASHQAALQNCLNGNYVSEQLRQQCAYIQTKFNVNQLDAVSADVNLQKFRTKYPKDSRGPLLEAELANRVRFIIEEFAKRRDYVAIAEFEQKARVGLLEFTLREPNLLMSRVEGWLSVGETKRALGLLQTFSVTTTDEIKRNEALAILAQLHLKQRQKDRAENVLKKLFFSDNRKINGLTDRGIASLREAASGPNGSKTAQLILIDELKFGRYVERDVPMLASLALASLGREDSEKIFETLMTTSPRNELESKQIENALMQYADELRGAGRLAKSGDVFLAAANLTQSTKKAEAAYKAGLMYARAGMVEKAKTAWQLSAADVSDKKFSSLSSERLERIR